MSHQIQFQKDLMNKFRENSKVLILSQKMTYLLHFENNVSLPLGYRKVSYLSYIFLDYDFEEVVLSILNLHRLVQ